MKPKNTLILAAVLVLLAGAAIGIQYSRQKSFSPTGSPIFPAYSAAKADGIDIDSKTTPVKLRKQGQKWVVATEGWHEADPKAAQDLLDDVSKFTSANLISTSPARQTDFEVDSTGVVLKFLGGGKTLASFIVGKAGPDYQSSYIRPIGQNSVYLVPSYLKGKIDRGSESWRRTLLLDFQSDAITSYTSKNPKETVTLEKDDKGSWKITAPFEAMANTQLLGFALRSLCQIHASGFADSTLTPEAAGISADTTTIVLHTSDGSTHTIHVGGMGERNQSYTTVDDDPTIYLVPRGRWNTVFRPAAMLKAPEAAGGAGAGMPASPPGMPSGMTMPMGGAKPAGAGK